MKLRILDKFLASISLIIIVLFSSTIVYLSSSELQPLMYYLPFVQLLIFIFSALIQSFLLLWILRIFMPPKEGNHMLSKGLDSTIWKLQGFLYVFNLGIFINSYLIPVNMRGMFFSFLGATIGKNVMVGGKIIEPNLIKIGDFTILGEDSLITAHSKERGCVYLKKILIGSSVTIGVKSVIMPGVTIGDNSIIAAGSIVIKNTNISANEIWAGVPAKRIKEIL